MRRVTTIAGEARCPSAGRSRLAASTPTFGTWTQQSGYVGNNVKDIGVLDGRSIMSKDSTKVMVDETDGTTIYAAHETIGMGHVFLYGDEWLTYTGEWTGMTANCNSPPYDSGYDPCYMNSPAEVFQIPQFWYNAITYAASSVTCFKIMPPPGTQIVY